MRSKRFPYMEILNGLSVNRKEEKMIDKKVTDYITIENAKIGFRNFSGRGDMYNAEGQRNFCVFLDEESAAALSADGWNVKWPKNRSEDDSRLPHLQVSIKFNPYPPNIVMITQSNGKVKLDESSIGLLDDADIETVDLRIRPYNWQLQDGRTGVKAYVKDMYVVIQEDPFAYKYATPIDDDTIPFK